MALDANAACNRASHSAFACRAEGPLNEARQPQCVNHSNRLTAIIQGTKWQVPSQPQSTTYTRAVSSFVPTRYVLTQGLQIHKGTGKETLLQEGHRTRAQIRKHASNLEEGPSDGKGLPTQGFLVRQQLKYEVGHIG